MDQWTLSDIQRPITNALSYLHQIYRIKSKENGSEKKNQRIFSFYLGHFSGSIDVININR